MGNVVGVVLQELSRNSKSIPVKTAFDHGHQFKILLHTVTSVAEAAGLRLIPVVLYYCEI